MIRPRLLVKYGAAALLLVSNSACLLLCAFIWTACSSGSPAVECNSLTCSGCCTSDGRCETGATINSCGLGGAACSTCSSSQECTNGRCEAIDGGGDGGLLPDGGPPPPTTYTFAGGCTGVTVSLGSGGVQLSGPCTLGSAGNFTLGVAALPVSIGTCGHTLVPSTIATWTQGNSVLYSTFVGAADVPCSPMAV